MDPKRVNQLLLLAEQKSGLTRTQMAKEMGWSRELYYKYLNCSYRIKQEDIVKIWEKFSLDADQVLYSIRASLQNPFYQN